MNLEVKQTYDFHIFQTVLEHVMSAKALEPSSHWAPRGRGASCTALAMTPEVVLPLGWDGGSCKFLRAAYTQLRWQCKY